MEAPRIAPSDRPQGVRTPAPLPRVDSPCPVCQERPIRGQQTVCSARCRARRWRLGKATQASGRDRGIGQLLEAALKKLEEGGR